MLTNAVIAGGLGAAYLAVLVLQLNPQVPLLSATTARWYLTLAALYGVPLAIVFYLLMVAKEFFSMRPLSPGWVSVRLLAWLAAGSALVAAILMWLNVQGFAAALSAAAARRMTAGAIATAVAALVLLIVAASHFSSGRRGSRVGAALFVIATVGSIALPIAARGPAVIPPKHATAPGIVRGPAVFAEPGPRVRMILLDGASLDYIWPRASEGRLPNFARLLDAGASMDLATVRPTAPDPVWAAAATGVYPARNGVRSAAAYYARGDDRTIDLLPDHCFSHALVHLGLVRDVPNTSGAWQARPLWEILSSAGISSGIVRWPLTFPVEPIDGFVVSDRLHALLGSASARDDRAVYPPALTAIARRVSSEDTGGAGTRQSAEVRDRFYAGVMDLLRAREDVQVAAIRYQGLDAFGHAYVKYAQARSDDATSQTAEGADALDRYYAFIDTQVGAAIDGLKAGDLLLVISGFGMQRQNVAKEWIARAFSEDEVTGTHERAPDGFLIAYGDEVDPGRHKRGSIVDVAPTVLYYLSLPMGRDMDGFARVDLFRRAFTAERPIAFIASYSK
jgi:predicted AlkP superfamily phosphohydrolase/phosphomutase